MLLKYIYIYIYMYNRVCGVETKACVVTAFMYAKVKIKI